jgi:hypothetical protein
MCQIFLGIPMLILAFAPITFPIIGLAVKYLSNEDGGVNVKEEIVIDNTIDVNGFSYSIDKDTARLEKIKDSTIIDIVVPNHIIVNGSCIPVTDVASCGLCEYNTDNILSYSSDVDIPLFFYYDNIERINSRVRSICPNLNDLFRLKTLNLYGDDYILMFDYDDEFLQGCTSLEEVRISGASIVHIEGGFNYCTSLKTLIFDDVKHIILSGGFKGENQLEEIIINGDVVKLSDILQGIVYTN